MGKHVLETIIGAVVLLVAAAFISIAYKSGNITTTKDGYTVFAKFDRADGLSIGSDVRVSGVKVGTVINQELDLDTYMAKIHIELPGSLVLPNDTSAEIVSDGLLGGKYIALVPGGEEDMLDDGDEIIYTQSSVNLEALIGKMVFGGAEDKEEEEEF